jgi:peptidylprolyl isomerase
MVVVGEGWLLKGLDERLEGLQLEETVEVEIPPEEAFGVRDPENVRMIPFRVLRSKGINPNLGAQVEVDGRSAVVRSIGAGRVQLDYNHPLAGRSIIYEVKVTEQYETDENKIRALIGRRFLAIDSDSFGIKLLKKKVRITVPEEIFFAENLQMAKRGVALDIQMFFPDIQDVEYVEVIKRRTSS